MTRLTSPTVDALYVVASVGVDVNVGIGDGAISNVESPQLQFIIVLLGGLTANV
jgi:hypothetical protein